MGVDSNYGIGSLKPGVCTSSTRPASPYNGQVIYMTDVDQTAVWDGETWVVLAPIAGGRNFVINGGYDIWQRGTSFSSPASGSYTADRNFVLYDGSGATRTVSRGEFDPYLSGASITASPPSGVSPTYFLRWNQSVAGSGATYNILYANRIENVRVIAGKKVTLSFYAKADASLTMPKVEIEQSFGTGGSPSSNVYTEISTNVAVTTSWQRFTYTFTVPSAAGKVIGTNANSSFTSLRFWLPINTTFTYDIWGVQLEVGAVATPFEFEDIGVTLAKCQRYYQRTTGLRNFALVTSQTATKAYGIVPLPVSMRVPPTSIDFNTLRAFDLVNSATSVTGLVVDGNSGSERSAALDVTASSMTAYRTYYLIQDGATSYLGFSAEL